MRPAVRFGAMTENALHRACVELLRLYEARGLLTFTHPANGACKNPATAGVVKALGQQAGGSGLLLWAGGERRLQDRGEGGVDEGGGAAGGSLGPAGVGGRRPPLRRRDQDRPRPAVGGAGGVDGPDGAARVPRPRVPLAGGSAGDPGGR